MLVGVKIKNYELLQLIGKGVIGETYMAEQRFYDQKTGEPIISEYTIKTVSVERAEEYGVTKKVLETELNNLKKISLNPICSKYISCYYEYIPFTLESNGNWIAIVMDYIHGQSLQEIILNKTIPFELSEMLKIMIDVTEAVEYIHLNKIAHQNLKPSNIIYDQSNDRYRLTDFAMSCSQNVEKECKGKYINVYYTPPDILDIHSKNEIPVFKQRLAHDIWSTGVIFYQVANLGQFPITLQDRDYREVSKDIRLEDINPSKYSYIPINGVIGTMLNKDWVKRPTAQQVLILIEKARPLCIINGKPIDYKKGKEIAMALGIYTTETTSDQELCEKLTNELRICDLSNTKYQKQQLDEIAKILDVKPIKSSAGLCSKLQMILENDKKRNKRLVTQELITSLQNIINLRLSKDKLNILEKLEKKYSELYSFAKQLDLIDKQLIFAKIEQSTKMAETFKTTNAKQSQIYEYLVHLLKQIIN